MMYGLGVFLALWVGLGAKEEKSGPKMPKVVFARKFCIVGAGPGGVQLAYFLQKAKEDYVVFERSDHPGSFYDSYPRHGYLISLTKKYTGNHTNINFAHRHDWNTLLADEPELWFREWSPSEDYYPRREEMIGYMAHFASKAKLQVEYNTNVDNIEKTEDG